MDQQETHSPEQVLDQLYQTGQRLMAARARERATGAPIDWAKGDNPPAHEEPRQADQAAGDVYDLRGRFQDLAREFIREIDAL